MKCDNCGAELREGAVFCGSCGCRIPVNFIKEEKIGSKKLKKERKIKEKKEKRPMMFRFFVRSLFNNYLINCYYTFDI